jgi:hypothetical protein
VFGPLGRARAAIVTHDLAEAKLAALVSAREILRDRHPNLG